MAKGITASEMGKRGGTTRAQRYSREQIRKWGRLGGRPTALGRRKVTQLLRLLARGKTQKECSTALGVSTRTVGRIVAQMKAQPRPEPGDPSEI
jgi:hypothetical protein